MALPMDMDLGGPLFDLQSKAHLLAGVPHDKKWTLLKDVLETLFPVEKVRDIARIMKAEYGFDANEASYRYHFKQWRWKKNVPSHAKNYILQTAQSRALQGKPTTALFAGIKVDEKKLKRQAKANARLEYTILDNRSRHFDHQSQVFGSFLPFGSKIFLNWNMPLAASGAVGSRSPRNIPRLGSPIATPSGVLVRRPSPAPYSPMQIEYLHDESSPISTAVLDDVAALDRTRLFLHGKFDRLAETMNNTEKVALSTWLHQFWMFVFVTCKHWGKESHVWTRDNLMFKEWEDLRRRPSPALTSRSFDEPEDVDTLGDTPEARRPSQLCQWSIHVLEDDDDIFYGNDEDNSDETSLLGKQLQNALESNDFSTIPVAELPLATPQMVKAVKQSPEELFLESFSFCIMARNRPLLTDMLRKVFREDIDVKSVYPLHIATSYLDGGTTCCLIIDDLCRSLRKANTFYTNDHGHTVLDNLMLTILKGHSNSAPWILHHTLSQSSRFAGAEVDLCGRWDADSPCYRALLQSGKSQVPITWKHKFCHTSILAVCHCIDAVIDSLALSWHLAESSGLFLKQCFGCGKALRLSVFHVLVLTTVQLARSGCEGEDLFGMIAVLLYMLANGMDPKIRSSVSIDLLLGIDDGTDCTHEYLRAIDLAGKLVSTDGWSKELQRGWQIFCQILRPVEPDDIRSRDRERMGDDVSLVTTPDRPCDVDGCSPSNKTSPDHKDGDLLKECSEECVEDWHLNGYYDKETDSLTSEFAKRSNLGHVWAAVQAELHSYRRINEGDPWVSDYFDFDTILTGLQTGGKISMPLLDEKIIKPYCGCGRWGSRWRPLVRDGILKTAFGNLDVGDRTSIIPVPLRFDA